jgi:hypothetical protein
MLDRRLIELAKQQLTIPELWRRLQLPGEPKASCRSPFRKDRKPSFSIYDEGRQAKDHATGKNYDGPAFLAEARDLPIGQAMKDYVALAGVESASDALEENAKQNGRRPKPSKHPDLSKLHPPTRAELHAIARDRGLHCAAPIIAARLGCLKCGPVCGLPSWVLTDPQGWNAEARRFSRLNYPAWRELSERKAHTIKDSTKSWPLGLGVETALVQKASMIAILEGGPDLLAAWHFIYCTKRWDVLPIAILGRAIHGLHVDALTLLKGKRVKFFPHVDPDDGPVQQVKLIAHQLRKIGCQPTYFDLTGLRTRGGKPVKDLNDLTRLDANQLGELRDLFYERPKHQ